MKKLNLTLSLAAGLLGGVISHYALVTPVAKAQAQTVAPKEVRAQSFVLMSERGELGGTMAFDAQGRPMIRLLYKGHEIFSAGGNTVRPLGSSGVPNLK